MTTHPPTRSNVEGHDHQMDHSAHQRRTLPRHVAEALAAAHIRVGWSYREAGRRIGVDWSFWRRLCRGERAPSRQIAMRIITVLDLPEDVAGELLAASVVREPSPPGQRGRVIRTGP